MCPRWSVRYAEPVIQAMNTRGMAGDFLGQLLQVKRRHRARQHGNSVVHFALDTAQKRITAAPQPRGHEVGNLVVARCHVSTTLNALISCRR